MKYRKLITHDNCADGLACAMIVRDAIPDIEVVFANYGQPSLEDLPATEGLLFCDITPPRGRVQEFIDAGATVLDHHKHARDIVEAFGAGGRFADETAHPSVSGATLAYWHVWVPTRRAESSDVETFARWVGVRDTWQINSLSWLPAQDLHAVLMGLPREFWLSTDERDNISHALAPSSLALGQLMRERRMATCRELADSGCQLIRGSEDRRGERDGGCAAGDLRATLNRFRGGAESTRSPL